MPLMPDSDFRQIVRAALWFDGAMLAVQVKSGGQVVDAPTLRELQGVMTNFGAARGLLVSWGGFTKSARAETIAATPPGRPAFYHDKGAAPGRRPNFFRARRARRVSEGPSNPR